MAGETVLRVAFAGHSCFDFSSFGKQLKSGGKSHAPFSVWISERLITKEELIFTECSPGFLDADTPTGYKDLVDIYDIKVFKKQFTTLRFSKTEFTTLRSSKKRH